MQFAATAAALDLLLTAQIFGNASAFDAAPALAPLSYPATVGVILISAGSLVCILSAVGVIALREPADKLHDVRPVTTVAPIAIAPAIVLEDGVTSQAGLKALCVAAAIVVTSPIVVRYVARNPDP